MRFWKEALTIGAPLLVFSLAVEVAVIHDAPPAYGKFSAEATVLVSTSDRRGHGSGVYIGDRIIITAGHVAKEMKDGRAIIKGASGEEGAASVLWFDETTDTAALKIDAVLSGMQTAPLACEKPDVAIGDALEAIGNPLNLENIHTWGRVASTIGKHGDEEVSFIADMTIARGMSGGPVFNTRGEIAGIVVAGAGDAILERAPFMIPLSYIVPKSVICKGLATPHDAPLSVSGASTGFAGLVKKAIQSGESIQGIDGEYRTLKHIEPDDTTRTHTADYFSVVGGTSNGHFSAARASIVSENWVKEQDGNWMIDQWLFAVTLDGNTVVRVDHNTLRETPTGTVLDSARPAAPTNEQAQDQFNKIMSEWFNETDWTHLNGPDILPDIL